MIAYINAPTIEEFLWDVINGNIPEGENFTATAKVLAVPPGLNTVMVCEFEDGQRPMSHRMKSLGEICKSRGITVISPGTDPLVMAFENPMVEGEGPESTKRLGNLAKELVEERSGLEVSIGMGRTYLGVKELRNSYREARIACKHRFYVGKGQVMHVDSVKEFSHDFVNIPKDIRADLMSWTLGGDKSRTDEILEDFFGTITPDMNPVFLKTAIVGTFYELLGLALKSGHQQNNLAHIGHDYIRKITQSATLEELKRQSKLAFLAVTDELFEVRKRSNLEVFKNAMNFIHENYNRDITLDDIAKHVHISPHHLSRGFKGFSGMNLSQYITKKRIEGAKDLLLTTDVAVGEVGKMVGYNDPNYFGRVFKNTVGVPPSSFRSDLGH